MKGLNIIYRKTTNSLAVGNSSNPQYMIYMLPWLLSNYLWRYIHEKGMHDLSTSLI